MKLLIARPKSKQNFALARLKVYSKGNINLPKVFLETLGLDYKSGGEIVAEANPLKGEVILRKKPLVEKLPTTVLKKTSREGAYILRGAYKEAEEFFKELAEGIKAVFPNAHLEIGSLDNNNVYLKLGPRKVFEEIHLLYWESPYKPRGVITLEGGIPQKTEKGFEISPQIEENLNLIRKYFKGKDIKNNGVELLEAPKFTKAEAMQIGLTLKDLLNTLFSMQNKSFKTISGPRYVSP